MKNLFVPYNLALILKEKGFDEPCFGMYQNIENDEDHNLMLVIPDTEQSNYVTRIPAPLYQQVIDWLWKEHKIFVSSYLVPDKTNTVMYVVKYKTEDFWETLNQAIEEALKLI